MGLDEKDNIGVDALEKLAYLVAEEFVGESKRRLTRELLREGKQQATDGSEIAEASAIEPRAKKAGGGS